MHFTNYIRQIFPNSTILDSALKYPITKDGWEVELPSVDDCRFEEQDYKLVLCLQDMLTQGETFPRELIQIHKPLLIV